MSLTNNQIEELYSKKVSEFVRTHTNLIYDINQLKNNIDCTVYIEAEKKYKVNFDFKFIIFKRALFN